MLAAWRAGCPRSRDRKSSIKQAHHPRKEYGESRYQATGYLQGRLMVLVFTPIQDGIRVISFRKANQREVNRHESNRRH